MANDGTLSAPPARWTFLAHSAVVLLLAAGVLSLTHRFYFTGMKASDGLTYTTVARNYSEGRGLVSSVIQPGLVDVVPSGVEGQGFVLQAPLWPILLGEWFKLVGPSFEAMHWLNGTLYTIAALQTWWLGFLLSRRTAVGYVATLMFVANPWILGSILLGMNVGVQAVIFGSAFLLLFCRPGWMMAGVLGVVVGLGILTRENSLFLAAPIGYVWYRYYREAESPVRAALRAAVKLALVLGIAFGFSSLESARKAALIGHADAPVFRLTFLYGTSAAQLQWHYVYNSDTFQINPLNFFLRHPKELLSKMFTMLWVGFVKETLPMLLTTSGWLVPIVFPWLFREAKGRMIAYGLMLMFLCQLALGSMSSLHFSYFFAFLPVLCPVIATTALELGRRAAAWRTPGFAAMACGLLLVYALLPMPYNSASLGLRRAFLGGDLHGISASQQEKMVRFVQSNTPEDGIIACDTYNSSFLPWYARRTVMQYHSAPVYRLRDNAMWRTVEDRIGFEYILYSSLAAENASMEVLRGFELVATLNEPDLQVWLFRRSTR